MPMVADARRLAIKALVRVETDSAYANVLLPKMLTETELSSRDKALVTELVYGSTRRKRSHDYVIDKFLVRDPPALARAALRIGTHQLVEMNTPPYAAVSATVQATPQRFRGLVNAVLRKVAKANSVGITFPNQAVALSYPDWILKRLVDDLGESLALEALAAMNLPAPQQIRFDGYVQDSSSAQVAAQLPVAPGDLVLDLCAAPGGKASAISSRGAGVVAADVRLARANLIVDNTRRLGYNETLRGSGIVPVVADGTAPPFKTESFDAVLVDAPCSGLGALRRRPDARWRIKPEDINALVILQAQLLGAAAPLVVRGGTLVYSVCTLTRAETSAVVDSIAAQLTRLGFKHALSDLSLPTSEQDGMFSSLWTRNGPISS